MTGTLRTGCLYADEAGGLQLLTSELPFTVKLECAELREDTQTLVRCCVRSADSRLINSRKVLLRVSVLVQADGYEPQTQSMSVLKDPPACLQLKTQTYETNAPVELSERAFQVSEELNLPDGRPQIARLVSCSLTPVVQEQGLVGSKAVLKGTANLQITYLDNENALRTLSFFRAVFAVLPDGGRLRSGRNARIGAARDRRAAGAGRVGAVAEAAVRRGAAGAVHGRAAAGADAL